MVRTQADGAGRCRIVVADGRLHLTDFHEDLNEELVAA
jgi:hypothetical protein